MTHLNALLMNLSNERIRLGNAQTQSERDLRTVWVKQLEKEVSSEEKFVGENQLSDDELLAALG
jgi:hypothetical protein